MLTVERTVKFPGVRSELTPMSSVRALTQETIALLFSSGNVALRVREGEKLLLGRTHPSNKTQPQIDLAEYGGLAAGTSRLHAAIHHLNQAWWLEDLGSSNGTWLNDRRLAPFSRTALTCQDHVMLANLELIIMLPDEFGAR